MTACLRRHHSSSMPWTISTLLYVCSLCVSSRRLLSICIVSGLLLMPQAMANDATDRSHAIQIAKEQNGGGGTVLGVTVSTDSAGVTRYAVKLLSNGRVRVFSIKKAR